MTLLAALGVGVVFVVGLLVEGIAGALIVLAVAAVLVLLTAAAWSHLPERGRPMRVVVVALVVLIAVVKLIQAL